MTLMSTVVAVTGGLTVGTFMAVVVKAGPGFLLYLAMLGDAAGWLLPGLLAQALPLGLFGGVLLARADQRDADGQVRPKDVLVFTSVLTLLSMVLTGWVMPQGYRATAAATAGYRTRPAGEPHGPSPSAPGRQTVAPAALDLTQLLEERSDEARADLRRRLLPVAGCFLAGLAAAGLLATRWRPTSRQAMGLTSALFVVQMILWTP